MRITTFTGQSAELAVANILKEAGYKMLDQNWKTPRCEIDIIAKKNDVIYFVEVKYRDSQNQGSGFSYITPKKLSQITFAARVWCQENNWSGDYRLLGAEVSGEDFSNTEIIEL